MALCVVNPENNAGSAKSVANKEGVCKDISFLLIELTPLIENPAPGIPLPMAASEPSNRLIE